MNVEKGKKGFQPTPKKPVVPKTQKTSPLPKPANGSTLKKEEAVNRKTVTKKTQPRKQEQYRDVLNTKLVIDFFGEIGWREWGTTGLSQLVKLKKDSDWDFYGRGWDIINETVPVEEIKQAFILWSRLTVTSKKETHNALGYEGSEWTVKVRNNENKKLQHSKWVPTMFQT